jgi:hypothetical protein
VVTGDGTEYIKSIRVVFDSVAGVEGMVYLIENLIRSLMS